MDVTIYFPLLGIQVVCNLLLSQINNVVINTHKSSTTCLLISSGKIPRSMITGPKSINILKALDKYYIAKSLDEKVTPVYFCTGVIFGRHC